MTTQRPHNARLEPIDYDHIRTWKAMGFTYASIARAYGVSSGYVWHVVNEDKAQKDGVPLLSDYDKRRIHRLHWDHGYEADEIAEFYDVNVSTIQAALNETQHAPKAVREWMEAQV
jgi:uncharacterized protein YjcR